MSRSAVAAIVAMVVVLGFIMVADSGRPQPAASHEQAVERVSVTKRVIAAPQASADQPFAPQIARTGNLSLFVASVERAVSSLSSVARNNAGDVLQLDVDNASGNTDANGELEIRVPASHFDRTMNAAAKVGKVRERSIRAEDVTSDLTDSAARLRNLRRTEADIRTIMDRSGTVSQILDAENQLSQVRAQIETLESSLKTMHAQVLYSTIDIDLQAEALPAPVEPRAASQLATAWQAALHALWQTTIHFVAEILWLVVFAPYVVLALATSYAVYGRFQKRRAASYMSKPPLTV